MAYIYQSRPRAKTVISEERTSCLATGSARPGSVLGSKIAVAE